MFVLAQVNQPLMTPYSVSAARTSLTMREGNGRQISSEIIRSSTIDLCTLGPAAHFCRRTERIGFSTTRTQVFSVVAKMSYLGSRPSCLPKYSQRLCTASG
jgi:hypothetical protein